MKAFFACLKKEWLESLRSGRLTVLAILFVLFGIMNPAIAKLTPWMMELMADALSESGLTVTEVTVDALTSWTQFYKNIPMALIVFVLMYSGLFTREYASGTLVLLLTKGLARYKVVLAKATLLLALWTGGYWLCFAVTYGYNAYYWDNGIVCHPGATALHWWLFGVWVVCLTVLFSTLCSSSTGVLLGTGGTVLAAYVVSLFPKVSAYMPTALMNTAALLVGAEGTEAYSKAIAVTAALCVACVAASVPAMNRKRV